MEEVWKDIKGYEGLYQVSNLGRIKALDRIIKDSTRERNQQLKSHILKSTDNGRGYQIVSLNKNGRKSKYVHRLVAETFIPNPDNKREVNHKDLDKKNNSVDNLEWVTQIENKVHFRNTDAFRKTINKRIQKNKEIYEQKINKYKEKIIQMYKNGNNIEEINKKLGICKSKITQILKENNVEIGKIKLFKSNLIIQKDMNNNVIRKFDNYKDIVEFVQNNKLSNAKTTTIRKEIHDAITKRRGSNLRYGYYWEMEKCYE